MTRTAADAEVTPGLYLVGTPIGNLEDITLRALRVLGGCDVVYAEDTRHTRALLTAHGLTATLKSLPAFAEERRLGGVIEDVERGLRVAICTDAGMPTISDPGAATARAARACGHAVQVIPGASAVTTALAGSGFGGGFTFLGFLPRSPGKLRRTLAEAVGPGRTVIFFESPLRLATTLRHAAMVIGLRRVMVARELTKFHETWYEGTATDLSAQFAAHVPRGECTILIEAGRE